MNNEINNRKAHRQPLASMVNGFKIRVNKENAIKQRRKWSKNQRLKPEIVPLSEILTRS